MNDINMTPEQLQQILDQAAEKGAARALDRVGLHDENAGNDIRELRGLLDAWRDSKKSVRRAVLRFLTLAILAGIAAYIGWPTK